MRITSFEGGLEKFMNSTAQSLGGKKKLNIVDMLYMII